MGLLMENNTTEIVLYSTSLLFFSNNISGYTKSRVFYQYLPGELHRGGDGMNTLLLL